MKRILLCFSHPDDESFSTAGTATKYIKAGWEVFLLTMTRGEAGEVGPYANITRQALADLRTRELKNAAETIGISKITVMDYRDGKLKSLNPGELEDVLYKTMAEILPDIVITFEPNGISNHPDHAKISLSTTYAFQRYAKERMNKSRSDGRSQRQFGELETGSDSEPKLYYVCMPESLASYFKKLKMIPTEMFGKPWKGTADKLITTVIDIHKYASIKVKALKCHITQGADVDRYLSLATQPMLRQEFFILRMQGIYEVFMGKQDRVSNKL